MRPGLLQQLMAPTFTPSRIPGLVVRLDRFSPLTRAAGQAAQFNSASSRYLSHAGNAQLRGIAAGWWRAGWIYLDSTAATKVVQSCLSGNTGYELRANATPALVLVAGDGGATATATHGTTLSTGTWYFVYFYYDGTNIGVSVNDGADVTAALSPYSPGTAAWEIGATVTPGNYFDGRMQCMCGGDGTLTAAQRTALYNAGVPLAYDQIAGAISQTPTFFIFEMNEPSGARADLGWILLSLTSNNSVGTAAGTALNACGQRNNQAAANHFSQATQALKPVIRAGGLRFDGTDDYLSGGTPAVFDVTGSYTIEGWFKTSLTVAGHLFSRYDDGTHRGFGLLLNDSGTVTWYHVTQGSLEGGLLFNSITSTGTYNDGKWHQGIARFTLGVGSELFIDGVSIGKDATRTDGISAFTQNLFVGAQDYSIKRPFNGFIRQVLLYNRALTNAQIAELYRYWQRNCV